MKVRQPLKVLTEDRIQRGMTPAGYARFLEQSRPTVHRWESGARKIDEHKLPAVAEKTGISPLALRPDLAALFSEAAQ